MLFLIIIIILTVISNQIMLASCSLEFEIPPNTQKGEISTIEGFLMTAAKNLGMFQEERLQQLPEVGEKVMK
jgi:C4-type Zn-finger protein